MLFNQSNAAQSLLLLLLLILWTTIAAMLLPSSLLHQLTTHFSISIVWIWLLAYLFSYGLHLNGHGARIYKLICDLTNACAHALFLPLPPLLQILYTIYCVCMSKHVKIFGVCKVEMSNCIRLILMSSLWLTIKPIIIYYWFCFRQRWEIWLLFGFGCSVFACARACTHSLYIHIMWEIRRKKRDGARERKRVSEKYGQMLRTHHAVRWNGVHM